MIIGRITAKSQTTIPRAVRQALGIGPGDDIGYEIERGRVTLKRVDRTADPFIANYAAFTEWADEADSAYDKL